MKRFMRDKTVVSHDALVVKPYEHAHSVSWLVLDKICSCSDAFSKFYVVKVVRTPFVVSTPCNHKADGVENWIELIIVVSHY